MTALAFLAGFACCVLFVGIITASEDVSGMAKE